MMSGTSLSATVETNVLEEFDGRHAVDTGAVLAEAGTNGAYLSKLVGFTFGSQ